MGVKFLGSIPIDPRIVESEDEGTNYINREFEAVAKRVIEEIERR
jgi:hypothetical protein